MDGGYAFSLSEQALLDSKLVNGQELSTSEVVSFKQLSADDKLYNRALRFVALRPRSSWEVEQYLQRKQAAPPLIEAAISKLTDIGLLDDAKVAAAYVHDRRLLRPTSERRLIAELKKKHIPEEIIREATASDTNQDQAALKAVIISKRRQTRYQDDQKLMQYLARQGFHYDDIKHALQNS